MTSEKKPAAKKDKVQGEGDYDAARRYNQSTEKFVDDHRTKIPEMAADAEQALEGPEGAELRKAEEIGKAKAKR